MADSGPIDSPGAEDWESDGSLNDLPRPIRRKLRAYERQAKRRAKKFRRGFTRDLEPVIDLGLPQLYAMDHFTDVQQEAFATTETRGGNPRALGVSTTWQARDGRTWPVSIRFDPDTQAYWFLDLTSGYLHGFDSGYHATEIPTLLWGGQLAPLPPEALEPIADAVVRKMVKLANRLTTIKFASEEEGLSFRLLDMVPFEAVIEVEGGRRRVRVLADTEELVEEPM